MKYPSAIGISLNGLNEGFRVRFVGGLELVDVGHGPHPPLKLRLKDRLTADIHQLLPFEQPQPRQVGKIFLQEARLPAGNKEVIHEGRQEADDEEKDDPQGDDLIAGRQQPDRSHKDQQQGVYRQARSSFPRLSRLPIL